MLKQLSGTVRWSISGTTAVEFAILAPVLIALIVTTLYLALALFAAGSLAYSVQQGARCAALQLSTCSSGSAVIGYTQSRYFGPGSPLITYSSAACGKQVSGSIDYPVNLILFVVTIPITANACFPGIKTTDRHSNFTGFWRLAATTNSTPSAFWGRQ